MTRSLRLGLIVVAVLLFFGSSSLVELYTDWLWFGEVGLQRVFQTTLGAQVLLGSVAFVVSAVWLAFNLRWAVSSLRSAAPLLWTGQGVPIQLPGRETLQRLTYVAAGLLAIPAALIVSSQWMTWLAFRYAVPFNTADPVLGHDIGFYIFTLPFIDLVRGGLMALVAAAAVASALVYSPDRRSRRGAERASVRQPGGAAPPRRARRRVLRTARAQCVARSAASAHRGIRIGVWRFVRGRGGTDACRLVPPRGRPGRRGVVDCRRQSPPAADCRGRRRVRGGLVRR